MSVQTVKSKLIVRLRDGYQRVLSKIGQVPC